VVVARVTAGFAVLSGVAAVAFAGWVIIGPQEAWLFVPRWPGGSPIPSQVFAAGTGLVGMVWAVTGWVLVNLRPRNVLGWLVLGMGVSQAWAVAWTAYAALVATGSLWPAYVGTALYIPGWLIPPTLLLALYPDGRLPTRRWRWPVAIAAAAIVVLTASIPVPVVRPEDANYWLAVPAFPERLTDVLVPFKPMYDVNTFVTPSPGPTTPVAPEWWPEWTNVSAWVFKPLLALTMLVIWVGTVMRLVRARPPRRQQLAWLLCAVMPFLAASLFSGGALVGPLLLLLVPIAVAVGVLRYHLLGIEAVLRRGLVYGTITAAVVGTYLIVTVGAGTALDRPRLPGVTVAAIVAVALAPARDRLQRAADHLVYGDRSDPLVAVIRLGQQVADTGELDLLPRALTSVMAAVHAPGAAVTTPDGRTIARVETDSGDRMSTILPLWFGGQQVGELRVAARRPGEAYTGAEKRLLAALALQVAVVVRAHDLTRALEGERDKVVSATEMERDRLRADLHDGLGPSLSGVNLGLQALSDALDGADNIAATALLARIRDEVSLAFAEVRRIIDGLRPTTLDTIGLREAIQRHATALSAVMPVAVDIPDLPPLPSQVETAAYRITTEALTNAVRHSDAHHVMVTLRARDASLRITVVDDGCGVGTATAGFGLTSMRRRAETLGGDLEIDSVNSGTTVIATLPLEEL
jgi:signal transduction histidine kinase